MTLTVREFRGAQPAFIDPVKYLESQIQFYLDKGYSMLPAARWGSQLDLGVIYWAAHFISLAALAASGGKNSIPGTVIGVLSGGTVDKVSYTRDVNAIMEDNAGHWGMTSFGLVFIRMARMMGAGPIQIGAPSFDGGSSGAWPGPLPGYW